LSHPPEWYCVTVLSVIHVYVRVFVAHVDVDDVDVVINVDVVVVANVVAVVVDVDNVVDIKVNK